jgi:hypothetical protein
MFTLDVQKVLLKGYDPEHSGASVVTTRNLNDFFVAPETGLVNALFEQERPDGAIYYADEVRLLAVRMKRYSRNMNDRTASNLESSQYQTAVKDTIGSRSADLGAGQTGGDRLCDSKDGGAAQLFGPPRRRTNCGEGLDETYNLQCLAGSDEPPKQWTHNEFMRHLYKGKPMPPGTNITSMLVKDTLGRVMPCHDTAAIWLYHASLNSSNSFKQYIEAMRDASAFTSEDAASVGNPSRVILGAGMSPSVTINGYTWPVHWTVPPQIPWAANISVTDVAVDDDGAAVPDGNVTLSDGSIFQNPGRIQLVDETVETISFSVLGCEYAAIIG